MTAAALPAALDRFREVWVMDSEFIAAPGERPVPLCIVALELRSGREVRRWGDELHEPLPIAPDALVVAYYASAEIGCYLALGWSLPTHLLDLFAEFRVFTNGRASKLGVKGASLLAALAYFGLTHLEAGEKDAWRERILAGPPYSGADRVGILDYCAGDVRALQRLLAPLVGRLESRPHWLEHALLRGRYMRAAARMEHTGVPLDRDMLEQLCTHWGVIKLALIDQVRRDYPIFDGAVLKMARFEQWLADQRIPWPRTETDRLSLSEDTFRTMARAYPVVAPIREVRDNLAKLRLTDLAVGADGRNRTLMSAFRARSGRNAPSASKFIFGPSVWLRSLIRPGPGRALAYIDWSAQETGIAAALSGDAAMLRAYASGDPYLAFAVDAGLAPKGATKATHGPIRDRCKAVVLGTTYGMQETTLGLALGIPSCEARLLLRAHRRAYATFWAWSQRVVDTAMLRGWIDTCFGWRLHISADTLPTSLLNHPMQAHGGEMLRLACTFTTEAGINVCAPVHDALVVEAAAGEIDKVVVHTRALMAKASRVVLGGLEIRTEADVVRYPARYTDPRGAAMWATVTELLETIATRRKEAIAVHN